MTARARLAWTTPSLSRLSAKGARMPDRNPSGEGASGKLGQSCGFGNNGPCAS
ncbi:hypothetical protein WJS89_08815 [Sphingomicrobium sp. XHP0235]|uniref:hypothetical protein n=1 Tax=Sphingomicrobium aquimarinum TaxID=3133971 RepID=UPI0031FF1B90